LARRRSGGNYYYSYNYYNSYTYSGSPSKQIAPYSDTTSTGYRTLKACYSYDRANDPQVAYPDRIRVFVLINDDQLLSADGGLVAEARINDLSDDQQTHVRFLPVSLDRNTKQGDYHLATFDITNENTEDHLVRPARVFRLFVNLHRKSEKYGPESAWGRIAMPYYVATGGETELDIARQQIVMRTFKEFYYRKQGWRSPERYSMDCYAYYMWATGFCTVGATNGRTSLSQLFRSSGEYHNGSQIAELSVANPIHGDYVRKPGHSFMLLSYDPAQKHVWTMEGNFNSTIEVVKRTVSSGWRVGHLREHHIRPGLFKRVAHRPDKT
jgi:hypothetical protein